MWLHDTTSGNGLKLTKINLLSSASNDTRRRYHKNVTSQCSFELNLTIGVHEKLVMRIVPVETQTFIELPIVGITVRFEHDQHTCGPYTITEQSAVVFKWPSNGNTDSKREQREIGRYVSKNIALRHSKDTGNFDGIASVNCSSNNSEEIVKLFDIWTITREKFALSNGFRLQTSFDHRFENHAVKFQANSTTFGK